MRRTNVFTNLIILAIFLSGFADAFRRFPSIMISLQGLLTILAAISSWFLILAQGRISKLVSTAPLLIAFIVIGLINLVFSSSTTANFIAGFQNLSVYMAFVGFLILATSESSKNLDAVRQIGGALSFTFKMSAVLYGFSILVGGPQSALIMGPRSFALFIILGSAWFLSLWRCRMTGGLFWFFYIELVLALSFSRMATVISILLFPISQASFKSPKDIARIFGMVALISIIAWGAFTYIEPIRNRFTSQGDSAQIAGIKVNTSGRAEFWEPIYTSAMESPLFGKGAGSVAEVVLSVNRTTGGHPHNDYLRIFHDFGILGFMLWIFGYFGLVLKTLRNWLRADEKGERAAQVHLAAFLALLAIALAMLTDNVIVYVFSMTPLGVLVGLSLGVRKHKAKRAKLVKTRAQEIYT
ncbi:O-antigen ligase [Thermoleptolyngbya sp. C42_A2020_037]|uniref:O-antigen ligase family protein n=1 Tax=Thermoleptolyngbya sp. C42_A2020_037 TaxID=2747799 RepID=UPI0019F336FB|nr:O-antigen ligase family protein [Thermoleptolyngbya sp. C42_A2020_037]MBF2086799.1 O-antigen ligase family protein [Thermoleptolyngbya sp. C42_A2020_037]